MSNSITNDVVNNNFNDNSIETNDSTQSQPSGSCSEWTLVRQDCNHLKSTAQISDLDQSTDQISDLDLNKNETPKHSIAGQSALNHKPSVSWTNAVADFFKGIGDGIAWAVSSVWSAAFGSATQSTDQSAKLANQPATPGSASNIGDDKQYAQLSVSHVVDAINSNSSSKQGHVDHIKTAIRRLVPAKQSIDAKGKQSSDADQVADHDDHQPVAK